jgi:outer membrane biosynthesis protein TonB
MVAIALGAALLVFCRPAPASTSEYPPAGAALPEASVCPVVYPLDQFPTERGFRYIFYGNAFFVNDEGYLITAAHVVRSFRDGGRPYILVETAGGQRRLQKTELVAEDWKHDVALLRAIPNPFGGQDHVASVSLTADRPSPGRPVAALSLFPAELRDPHTSEAPVEMSSPGEVIDYQFYADDKGTESELLLFSHKVIPGQSGSPVFLGDSRKVVGIVVGQWLDPTVIHVANSAQPVVTSPGAALSIHYAIALLRRQGISWQTSPAPPSVAPASHAARSGQLIPPAPLSLVGTPYPRQALFGGEVVLDALIDTDGRVAEVNVVHGAAPYLDPVLDAVHTWTFSPAKMNGRVVAARIGIVFQFPQSFMPKMTAREHKYERPLENSASYAALPVSTVEPAYPPNTNAEGSVILYGLVDALGQISSTRVLRDLEPLTAATLAAVQQWHFVPAKKAGASTNSAVVLVVTFRHP